MPATLPDGLYKLAFEARAGTDYGVAYLRDGRLRGGDSSCAYVGTYRAEGQLFSAEMTVTQHRHVPGVVSALGLHDVLVSCTARSTVTAAWYGFNAAARRQRRYGSRQGFR